MCHHAAVSHAIHSNGRGLITAAICKSCIARCALIVILHLPQAMSLYWATSSCYGLLQNALLKIPDVRRMLGILITPSESKTPFKDIYHIFEERAKKFIARQK